MLPGNHGSKPTIYKNNKVVYLGESLATVLSPYALAVINPPG
jgi:hypothetical protein